MALVVTRKIKNKKLGTTQSENSGGTLTVCDQPSAQPEFGSQGIQKPIFPHVLELYQQLAYFLLLLLFVFSKKSTRVKELKHTGRQREVRDRGILDCSFG
jgi:hypothetical protein